MLTNTTLNVGANHNIHSSNTKNTTYSFDTKKYFPDVNANTIKNTETENSSLKLGDRTIRSYSGTKMPFVKIYQQNITASKPDAPISNKKDLEVKNISLLNKIKLAFKPKFKTLLNKIKDFIKQIYSTSTKKNIEDKLPASTILKLSKKYNFDFNCDLNIEIPEMSNKEEGLLKQMIKSYKEQMKNNVVREELNELRYAAINENLKSEISNLYRPGGNEKSVDVNSNLELSNTDKKILADTLNAGKFDMITQFTKVGFYNDNGNIEFNMIHPLVQYLGIVYNNNKDITITLINSFFFNDHLKAYSDYMCNKEQVDEILSRIYHAHDNTLLIKENTSCRNIMI